MNKTSILLGAMLCAGVAQMTVPQMSQAQQAPMSFKQIFAQSKQDFDKEDYALVEEDARGLLVLARSPQERGQAMRLLGEALYRGQSYDAAIEQWNQLLDLTGTGDDKDLHGVAHLGLARTYNAQGSYDKAVPHYEAFIKYINQKDGSGVKLVSSVISLAVADAFYNAHKNDLALEKLDQIVASASDNPALLVLAYTRAGQINMEQRKFEQARIAYEQVSKQVDAAKVEAESLRTFAKNQIVATNLLSNMTPPTVSLNGKLFESSQVNYTFQRSLEFDQKLSDGIAKIVDGGLANQILKDEPFSGK